MHTASHLFAKVLCILTLWWIAVIFSPLQAKGLDLGIGLGLVHSSYKTTGEIPDFASRTTYFRDFPTVSLEAGIPLSRYLKLSARLYPHSRNYNLWEAYADDFDQLMEYYLNLPVSIRARLWGVEFGGGASLGFQISDIGMKDFYYLDEDDLKKAELPFMKAAWNLGLRVPLNKSRSMALDFEYHQDFGSFSDVQGFKVYHRHIMAGFSARLASIKSGEDLANTPNISSVLEKIKPGIGFGFQLASQNIPKDYEYNFDEYKFRKTIWLPSLDFAYSIHPNLDLHSGISTNKRSVRMQERGDHRKLFKASGAYVDIPLALTTTFYHLQYSAGFNLSILTDDTYTRDTNLSPNHLPYKVAKIIPAFGAKISLSNDILHRISLNIAYSHDLSPYLTNYNYAKTQEQLKVYATYRLHIQPPPKDLIPESLMQQATRETAYSFGLKRTPYGAKANIIPALAMDDTRRFPSGWGLGYRLTASAFRGREEGSTYSLSDLMFQGRVSFRKSFAELWLGTGFGVTAGTIIIKNSYMIPVFPVMLPRTDVESGIRFHISSKVALDASLEFYHYPNILNMYSYNKSPLPIKGIPSLCITIKP